MAQYIYTCHSPECNGREFSESRADVAVCTSCGSSNISRKSSSSRMLYLITAMALLGVGGWYLASLLGGDDPIPPNEDCALVAVRAPEVGKCGFQLEPVFDGGCQPDTLYWTKDGIEQLPLLTSMGQFDIDGDVTLRFALQTASLDLPGKYQELILSCNKAILTASEKNAERKRIEGIVQAHLTDPFGPSKYDAFDVTKSLPDGSVRLPDGRMTSGISWQNLLLLLWPDKRLNIRIELDDYGDITTIYFSK